MHLKSIVNKSRKNDAFEQKICNVTALNTVLFFTIYYKNGGKGGNGGRKKKQEASTMGGKGT